MTKKLAEELDEVRNRDEGVSANGLSLNDSERR
jgi:hypothetical protein